MSRAAQRVDRLYFSCMCYSHIRVTYPSYMSAAPASAYTLSSSVLRTYYLVCAVYLGVSRVMSVHESVAEL